VIQNDEQLHQAQADIQKLWSFLEHARQTHSPDDYERLARPYLLRFRTANRKFWSTSPRSLKFYARSSFR
jgi:hypothetical protein